MVKKKQVLLRRYAVILSEGFIKVLESCTCVHVAIINENCIN